MIGHTLSRQQRLQQFFRLPQAHAHRLASHREPLQLLDADDDRLLQTLLGLVPLGLQPGHLCP
jgi:hypothetical protein